MVNLEDFNMGRKLDGIMKLLSLKNIFLVKMVVLLL